MRQSKILHGTFRAQCLCMRLCGPKCCQLSWWWVVQACTATRGACHSKNPRLGFSRPALSCYVHHCLQTQLSGDCAQEWCEQCLLRPVTRFCWQGSLASRGVQHLVGVQRKQCGRNELSEQSLVLDSDLGVGLLGVHHRGDMSGDKRLRVL